MQSISPIPMPLLKRAKSHTIIPGNKQNTKSRISHPQKKFQIIAITVHPISQHTDTLWNNKSVAAGSKKHKIIKIHLACVMIFLHHPVWHSGCSSDDLKPLKALLTLHFFLAPHNLDLCENDFHLM